MYKNITIEKQLYVVE